MQTSMLVSKDGGNTIVIMTPEFEKWCLTNKFKLNHVLHWTEILQHKTACVAALSGATLRITKTSIIMEILGDVSPVTALTKADKFLDFYFTGLRNALIDIHFILQACRDNNWLPFDNE